VSVLTNAPVSFGVIPAEHWYQPDSIDEAKAQAGRDDLVANNVIYGGSVSYRNMCRFNSGFFYRHPLLAPYRWYWRVEPDVHFSCDVNHDPFAYMVAHNKTYGWTISMYEFQKTIPSLWGHVRDFMAAHPEYVADGNAMGFLSDNGGQTYNLCHFWSNFEIADLDFWRGEAYAAFFEHLDRTGGFYYERWGDAPVHSIAAALFLPKERLHWFNEIGYFHNPFTHCPRGDDVWREGRCACDPKGNFGELSLSLSWLRCTPALMPVRLPFFFFLADYNPWSSCMRQWDRIWR
jgi:alpha 1,2-mannosyltransferase